MIDWIVSDLHLDHANIIEYCDRPFDSVEEMDKQLIANWNNTVTDSDTVLFLGDLTMCSEEKAIDYYHKLNGDIIFIEGNHDSIDSYSGIGVVYDSVTLQDRGITFHCTHYPTELDEKHNNYVLHGHTHNNEMNDHPFFNPQTNHFNFSAELINYTPVPFDLIESLIFERKSERIDILEEHIY